MKKKRFFLAWLVMLVMFLTPPVGHAQITCTGSNACEIIIQQHSTSMWGWYDCSIAVYQGTELRGQTHSGFDLEWVSTIPVCAGDSVSFVWTGSYFSSSSVSFEILDAGGNTLYTCTSGSNLSDGLFYTTMATCPTCIRPAWVTVDSITTSTAVVAWAYDSTAYMGYEVEHGPSGFTPGVGEGIVHTIYGTTLDTTLYIDLLQTNTLYDVYVRNICSPADTSARTRYTFRTACNEYLALPFDENFDAQEGGVLPPCWFSFDPTASYPATTTSTYNSYLGAGRSIEFRDNVTLIASRTPIPVSQVYTSFVYQNQYGNGGNLQVGYVTDLADPNSFVLLRTIPYVDNGWMSDEVDFANYTSATDTGYVAFRQAGATSSWSSLYMDNIHIERTTSCQQVSNARIYNITNSNATVRWNGFPYAQYTLAWGVNDNVAQIVDSVTAYADSIILTTLQGGVTYYLWIRTECLDGSSSRWLRVGSFTTLPDCVLENLMVATLDSTHAVASWDYAYNNYSSPNFHLQYRPYGSTLWTSDSTSANQYLMGGLAPGLTYQFKVWNDYHDTLTTFFSLSPCDTVQIGVPLETSSYLPIYTSNGYSYTQQIFRSAELASLGDTIYGISFFHPTHESGARTLDVYLGTTMQDAFGTTGDYVPLSQLTLVDSNCTWNIADSGHCTITFPTPFVYNGTGNLVLAINDRTGSYANFSGFYSQQANRNASVYYYSWNGACDVAQPTNNSGYTLDSRNVVTFHTNCDGSCPVPVVSVVEALSDQVVLQWTAADAAVWSVEYRRANSEEGWTFVDTVSLNNIAVTGLAGGSQYEFRVGANCTNPHYGYATAYTTCGSIDVPHFEGFDAGVLPHCWNAIATTANVSGQEFLLGKGYLVMPQVSIPVAGLRLRFQVRPTYDSATIIIGVMNAIAEPSSFEPVDTLVAGAAEVNQYLTANFDDYLGAGRYVAIYVPTSRTVYVDNITLSYPPNCEEPGIPVVDSVEQYAVTLSWSAPSDANYWVLEYGPVGFAEGSGTFVPVYGNPATLTGLDPATDYEVSVQAICSPVDSSYRTSRVAFTTLCAPVDSLPYAVSFDDEASNQLPHCWQVAASALSDSYYQPKVYDYDYYAHSGNQSLYMYGSSLLAMPELDADLRDLQMTFWMRYGWSTGSGLQVGIMSDPADTSTFTPLTTVFCNDSTSYTNYTVSFANYTGTGRYIAFRNIDLASGSDYAEVYIDDITVGYSDGCIRPQDLVVTGFGDTTVSLQWTAIGNAAQWQVGYDTSAAATPANIVTLDSTYATIGGLAPTVAYYFYVRSLCDSLTTSPWVGPVVAVPASYTMIRNGCDTISVCQAVIFDNGGLLAPYPRNSYDTLVVMPSTPGAAIVLSGDYDVTYIFDELFIYNGVGTQGEALVYNTYNPRYADHGALSPVVSTDSTGALTIVLSGANGAGGFAFYTHCTSCLPTQLQLTAKTSLTATIHASAPHFQFQFRPVYDTVWHTLMHNDTADLYIDTLVPATRYAMRARTICPAGDTSLWGPVTYFATNHCPVTVQSIPTVDSANVNELSWELPVNAFYEYSYSQQIFDSSELGGYQEIGAMSIYYDYPTPTTAKDSVVIYLANTHQSTFSNITGFVTTGLHEVYRGPLCVRQGWNEIPFDTIFTYWGSDNLLVAFEDLSGNIDPNFVHLNNPDHNEFTFRTHPTVDNKSIVAFNGQDPISPSSASSNLITYKNYRNDIRFHSCTLACGTPVIDSVAATEYDVTLFWSGSSDQYQLAIGRPVDTSDTSSQIVTVDGNQYTFTGLRPNTGYTVALRQDCGFEYGTGSWIIDTVRTLSLSCATPYNLHVDSVNNFEAFLSWASEGEVAMWYVFAEGDFGQRIDSTYTTDYHLTDLNNNMHYRLSVQAACYPQYGIYSGWSDTIQFATSSCDTVNDVRVEVSGTTAVVSWTPGDDAGPYEIAYGYAGFDQETGTTVEGIVDTTYTIVGLEPEELYDVYVRTQCGHMFYSVWSEKITFATTLEGIAEAGQDGHNVSLYPNPTQGGTTLHLSGFDGPFVVEVSDLTGRTVMRHNLTCQGDCTHTLDLGDMPSGSYFVKVSSGSLTAVRRVVVR